MQLIGKRGDFSFYKQKGYLKLLGALPRIEPDHIIAGGAPIAILQDGKIKDIDIWVSGNIPVEATKESQYAFNYRLDYHPNVQYMKIRATTPSALLDTFDIDACKCAFYNITDEGYDICLHNYLKPLLYKTEFLSVCGVNPKAYNRFSMMRFHKYATKFGLSPMTMYRSEDYAIALQQSEFSDRTPEEIQVAIETYDTEDQYELLDHLRNLFSEPVRAVDIGRLFGNIPVSIGVDWARAINTNTPIVAPPLPRALTNNDVWGDTLTNYNTLGADITRAWGIPPIMPPPPPPPLPIL